MIEWVYLLEGKEVTEAEFEDVFPDKDLSGGFPGTPSTSGWPLLSDALAVHPRQVDEANERNRKAGVSVTYRRDDGRAIIPDRNERRKLLRLENLHDRDACYSD